MQSMMKALRALHVARSIGASLFLFATRGQVAADDPLTLTWRDGTGKPQTLIK
jgi:hypothetical protein